MAQSSFVHLHVHSDYSLLHSTSSVSQIVEVAQKHKMSHIALTDTGNLFGAVEFYKRCCKAQPDAITPIIGCDFYIAEHGREERSTKRNRLLPHIVLLAKNNDGYANLVQLSTRGYTEGFYYKPRIDDALLEEYHHNLIALCGGMYGDVGCHLRANRTQQASDRIEFYLSLFGRDRFYLELQDHQIAEEALINQELYRLAKQYDVELVATNNTFYTHENDANAHNILRCIQSNRTRKDVGSVMPSGQYFIKSAKQMAELFKDAPDALSNTVKIAEQCAVELNLPGPQLPDFSLPEGYQSPEEYLRHLSLSGLGQLYPKEEHAQLRERLDYELSIISQMGYTGYFLIVWDFVRFAHENGIPVGPGRGSGAGSLVAYCLRITNIDPMHYRLIFERFLNPDRVSMPDFDIDFCYERRGELIDYVTQKYGSNRVGQIITFGTLGAKAALRDVARVLDIPFGTALELTKLIPSVPSVSLAEALKSSPELRSFKKQDPIYEELFSISQKLEGLHRHASTHAAGIVIGRSELTDYVPLYRDPRSETITTQFSMEYLEECGLVKMDLLGLKTLTLVKNCQRLICQTKPDFDIAAIPMDDKRTFEMLGRGESVAVFQFEGGGMQRVLPNAKPERVEDLIALTALYRPGPMEHIDSYIDVRHGRKTPNYVLPQLADLLSETGGIIVYQEQVIEIVKQIGGFSLGQADVMRRAMGKKQAGVMAELRGRFVEGAVKNGFSKGKAEEIFELLSAFAGYGFNKSHAAAYAVLAYQTAYLKAHFPVQFMAANLTNEMRNTDQFSRYLQETRRMGIEIIAPDIQRSQPDFSVQDGKIIFGLNAIKTVGTKAVEEIMRARSEHGPFESLTDFITAAKKMVVTRKTIEACVLSGLFDAFGDRALLFHNLEYYFRLAEDRRERMHTKQQSLFDGGADGGEVLSPPAAVEPFTLEERVRYEKQFLGAYFSGHPLDNHTAIIDGYQPAPLANHSAWNTNEKYLVIAFISSYQVRASRKGDSSFLVLEIEDKSGGCECVKFSPSEEEIELIKQNPVLGFQMRVIKRDLRVQIQIVNLYTTNHLSQSMRSMLYLRLSAAPSDVDEQLQELRDICLAYPGQCAVMIQIADRVVRASADMRVKFSDTLTQRLNEHAIVEQVIWK